MAGEGFVWEIPPHVIAVNLDAYSDRLKAAIFELAEYFSAVIEAYAKSAAPWTDRTGAARQGLRATAAQEAAAVVLTLAHSVSYGVYLETGTSRMSPRSVILPTLESFHQPIMAALRRLIGG